MMRVAERGSVRTFGYGECVCCSDRGSFLPCAYKNVLGGSEIVNLDV